MPWTTPTVPLGNGVRMPVVGFGVYQIPDGDTERAVTDALAAGYRHLDTAAVYGNEAGVGRAIRSSGLPRDELFVTTKLWIQAQPGEAAVQRAFDASLRRLGLDVLDLYLVHQPFGDYYSAWRALQDLHRQGAVRAIGVSNFHSDRLVDLAERHEVVPAVDQVESHALPRPVRRPAGPAGARRADGGLGTARRGEQGAARQPDVDRHRRGARQDGGAGRAALAGPARRRRDPQVGPAGADGGEPRPVRRRAERREMAQIGALDTGTWPAFDHRDPDVVARQNRRAEG